MAIVYCAKNTISEKYYIGQTTKTLEKRISTHYRAAQNGRTNHFAKALRKYDPSAYEWAVLCECSTEELNLKETYWIALYKKSGLSLYNMTPGGDANPAILDEVKEKISKSKTGHKHSEETKQKISSAKTGCKGPNAGRKFSDVHRKHMSDVRIGMAGFFKGKSHSAETRELLSKIKIGKCNPKTSGAKHWSARRVVCLTDDICFHTASMASEFYGINKSQISRCCNGQRATAIKRTFSYI